jgi:hypothetical protein
MKNRIICIAIVVIVLILAVIALMAVNKPKIVIEKEQYTYLR